ncbi:hydroxylysine kinase-like isoform X2 [Notolabrus celidotus]|nr:hydroxylysine kinase-like isoform X2 [Notolabrus celidotus]
MDQNFLVKDAEGTRYVLKIMNSEESKDATLLGLQTLAMSFLLSRGVPAQTALCTTTGRLMTSEETGCGPGAQTFCVRLMTYLPGDTIAQSPVTTQDLYRVGKLAANIDKALQQLQSPDLHVLQRDGVLWTFPNFCLLEDYLSVMDGDPLQDIVRAVLDQFRSHVQPRINTFQKGIIHGDLSDQNILVTPGGGGHHEVSGVLDFSFLMNGCYVFELAVSIMYLMLENPRPLDVGGAVLAGWESIMPLNEEEKDSLFLLVLARFCQSLVYGRFNARRYPDNKKFILTTAESGSRLLTELWERGKTDVEQRWFKDASVFSEES